MLRNRKLLSLGVIAVEVDHDSPTRCWIKVYNCYNGYYQYAMSLKRVNSMWRSIDHNQVVISSGGKWKHLNEVIEYILDNGNLGIVL